MSSPQAPRPRTTPISGEHLTRSVGWDDLSQRQQRILEVIHQMVSQRGYPPTVREIGQAVGLTSPSSVAHQLEVLQAKGFLRRDPNLPRAIEVVLTPGPKSRKPRQLQIVDAPDATNPPLGLPELPTPRYIPLVGRIAAGVPITAEESVEELIPVPEQLAGEGTLFMLQVQGDSMVEAAICSGDWVVIRQQSDAVNGDIVAAMIDSEATVKTFRVIKGKPWLYPANPDFEPFPADHAAILGKVKAVMRKL